MAAIRCNTTRIKQFGRRALHMDSTLAAADNRGDIGKYAG